MTPQQVYMEGLCDGIRAYAYSSSEPWAENGVQYVGTTGKTLAAALDDAMNGRYPPQPNMNVKVSA